MSSPSKTHAMAWTVWIVASIFYAYQYILRVMPNIMLNDIMQQFEIGAGTFGQFSGVYYIGYSLLHLPVGILLDRYGPRKMMTACILLTVLGTLPLIFAKHWFYPIAGRFLIGLGSSAAILGVFKIIRIAFSEEKFARMLSLSVTVGLIGAIYGGAPVSYMREILGYHAVIQIMAVAGILLAALTYWIIPHSESAPDQATVFADIKEVFGNWRVIGSCFFAGLMVGPLEGFADVWGTAFLKQVYGFEATLAASLPSLIFIGMCFGSPFLSLIAEKMGYLTAIVGAGAMMALCFFLFLTCPLSSALLSLLFILIGVCCAYQILAIYKTSTYASERMVGLTTAVANMIIMIFGYAFHTAMGGIINHMGGPANSQALAYGISVIPIALCIGTAGFIFLLAKEKAEKVKTQLVP